MFGPESFSVTKPVGWNLGLTGVDAAVVERIFRAGAA